MVVIDYSAGERSDILFDVFDDGSNSGIKKATSVTEPALLCRDVLIHAIIGIREKVDLRANNRVTYGEPTLVW